MSYTPIITITFKIQDFLGDNASNAQVSVHLKNFGSDNPRVPGSCIISTPWVPVALDGTGGGSFTPIGNDVITPSNTYYEVKFTADTANTAELVIPYQFTGSGTQDLSQIIPFNQFGGSGGPSVSNLVIKNPTALQIISGFGLSVPQIQDLTAPLLPHTAAGTDIGSAALPFANLYVGSAASNNIKITGSATAARTFTLPDANSNPVQPVSGATAHQWLTFIDSSGVQHTSQPSFSDLSGTLTIGQVPTITSAQVDSSIEIVAHKNVANGYAGLDGTAKIAASQLPNPSATTLGGVESIAQQPSKWISTISTSGVPSLTQPAFADISGTLIAAQEPSTTVNAVTNDTNVHGSISAQTLTISWNGLLGLARGGLNADLSATGGASQVLKQTGAGAAITVGQLAFSDISGSVGASQLPNPTASTLGGIESIAAVSHKWIDSISTSGVPHQSQPAAADLSDGTTGSGLIVLSTSPTLTTPNIGAATATSIVGLTGAVTPNAAGGTDIGSAVKPFANLYIGGSATNNIKITGTATAARTFTLPDADSNPVQPFGGASHQFVTSILSTGLIVAARPSVSDLSDGVTGTGVVVLATSPTLVTPTLGVASATSINKLAITAPATGSTLAIADGKTLTANNSLTFAGTDATTLTFQATGTVVNRDSTDTLTHKTIDTAGTGNHVQLGGVDLPASIGTSGQVLTNNSGVLAFTTVSGGGGGTPGGATNSIQYNDGSAFAGLLMLSPAGTILPNLVFRNIYKNITSTGNTDLYTCPAGKRAIACEIEVFNNSGASLAWYTAIKIGGNYFQSTSQTSTGNNAAGSRSSHYILEAGESIAINADHQPCNVWGGVFEFDNTSNLKSGRITTFIAGDNTVYTVPNGKTAIVLPNTFTPCNGTAGTFSYGNLSGGSRTVTFNLVSSGGTPGTTNQIAASGSVLSPNTTFNPTSVGLTMAAGDFFSINSDANTAGQFGFVTVVEI